MEMIVVTPAFLKTTLEAIQKDFTAAFWQEYKNLTEHLDEEINRASAAEHEEWKRRYELIQAHESELFEWKKKFGGMKKLFHLDQKPKWSQDFEYMKSFNWLCCNFRPPYYFRAEHSTQYLRDSAFVYHLEIIVANITSAGSLADNIKECHFTPDQFHDLQQWIDGRKYVRTLQYLRSHNVAGFDEL